MTTPDISPIVPEKPKKTRNLWLVYFADWSDFAVFGREIEALRYSALNSMLCKPIEYGKSVHEQIP